MTGGFRGIASWELAGPDLTWSPSLPRVLGLRGLGRLDVEQQLRGILEPVLVSAAADPGCVEWDLELSWQPPQRAECWLRVQARSVPSVSGAPGPEGGAGGRRLTGVVSDVSHTRVTAPLDDVGALYRLLVELSPDGIVVHQDGVIVYANPTAARMVATGRPDALVGTRILDWVRPGDRAAMLGRIAAMADTDTHSEPADLTLLGLNGSRTEASSRSVRTSWRGRPAFQVLLRDLTASREADQTLQHQASLLAQVSDGIVATDVHLRITSWNPAAERIFGWAAEDVLGREVGEVLDGLAAQSRSRSEGGTRHRDGRLLDLRTSVTELRDGDGEPGGLVIVCTDETQRRQAERGRKQADERYAAAVAALEEGVVVLDHDGLVESANAAALRMLALDQEDLLGLPLHAAVVLRDEQGNPLEPHRYPGTRVRTSGEADERMVLAMTPRTVDGVAGEPLMVSVAAQPLPPTDGRHPVVVSLSDFTESWRHADRLYAEARHDPLTGLRNRTAVLEHLQQMLDERERGDGRELAVLFIDLDRFKVVNDSLGREAGDCVLRAVADRLVACCGADDVVGRLSTDEFVVVTPCTVERQPQLLAARVVDVVRLPIATSGRNVVVRCSIGIAGTVESPATPAELLRDADVAMARAKNDGRGRVVSFDQRLRQRAVERLAIEEDLREALASNQLWVAYQPIVRISDMTVIGAEALARWTHPERGVVPPDVFIPLAEDAGLVDEVFDQIMLMACQQAAAWRVALAPSFGVSVNLSARQLIDPDLLGKVRRLLAQSGLPATALTLELTESGLMEDADAAAEALRAFNAEGIRLSIDDFGTGYSSLSYLRRFATQVLKIDRSFIRDICDDPQERAIVHGILALGLSLDRHVIAEGVETAEQVEVLRELGCDLVQGYHFSRPLPAEACTSFLSEPGRLPAPSSVPGPVSVNRPAWLPVARVKPTSVSSAPLRYGP